MIAHVLDYLYRPVHPMAQTIYRLYDDYRHFNTITYGDTPRYVWDLPSKLYANEYICFHEWYLNYLPEDRAFMKEMYGE